MAGRIKQLGARTLLPRLTRHYRARVAIMHAGNENARHFRGGPCIAIVAEHGRHFFYRDFLAWAATHDYELRRRICLTNLPAALPPETCVLHAWVQDPVRERSATLFAELEALEAGARTSGIRVIQPARVLSNTDRLTQFDKLRGGGVHTPRVAPVGTSFGEDLGGLRLPIVVRRNRGHGMPMFMLPTHAHVRAWCSARRGEAAGQWVAGEFHDVRGADGLYRKYRYFLAGSQGTPRHMIASREWEVRPKGRVFNDALRQAELAFLHTPFEWHDRFDEVRRALGYDLAAFDYSLDQRGDVIVWEVNPFPDLRPAQERLGGRLVTEMSDRTYRLLASFYRNELRAASTGIPSPT